MINSRVDTWRILLWEVFFSSLLPLVVHRMMSQIAMQPRAAASHRCRWSGAGRQAQHRHVFCEGTGSDQLGPTGKEPQGKNPRDRLFSNLNPKTMQHEPGSVWGSALLVSGTTIGAGILALPAVTQDAGFVPASVTLTAVCGFSIVTGLLIAETSLRLIQQQGAGSVSMITMARTTLGSGAAAATSAAYVFLHYALLVAYISKAGEIVGSSTGLPLAPAAAAFTVTFALVCYLSSQKTLDSLNGGLVGLVVACFLGLLLAAGPGVDAGRLLEQGDWSAVPATLPVVALAFVYHNIVPVLVNALEADVGKIRTAICAGVAIPWLMFVSWEAAILGSLGSLQGAAAAQAPAVELAAATRASGQDLQHAAGVTAGQQQQVPAPAVAADGSSSSQGSASQMQSSHASDPLDALAAGSAIVGPLIQGFSFLAIATSYIGFILGLTDFMVDAFNLPNRQAPVPYLLTLLPPFGIAVTNPNIFLQALDTAGTYGVLTLFGILPAAMTWKLRYGTAADTKAELEVVSGGRPLLLAVGFAASAVVAYEFWGLVRSTAS